MHAIIARKIAKKYRQVDKTVEVERIIRDEIYKAVYNGKTDLIIHLQLRHNIKKIVKSFKNDGYEIEIISFTVDGDNVDYLYKIKW